MARKGGKSQLDRVRTEHARLYRKEHMKKLRDHKKNLEKMKREHKKAVENQEKLISDYTKAIRESHRSKRKNL